MAPTQKDQSKPESTQIKQKGKYVYAHGRRKEAAARLRLYEGPGEITINGKLIEDYFPSEVYKTEYMKPFYLTQTIGKYHASIKVRGSGKLGQLGAVVHAIAKALDLANEKHRPILRKAGLLTRDPRVKERRKYGLAQKARKGKQSPKR